MWPCRLPHHRFWYTNETDYQLSLRGLLFTDTVQWRLVEGRAEERRVEERRADKGKWWKEGRWKERY